MRRPGSTFEPGRASVFSGEGAPLCFFVDRDGDVVLLERLTSPATWSEVIERQARQEARARL